MFLLLITSSAYSQSAKVTLSLKNAGIVEVMDEIKKQSGYKFVYRTDLFKNLGAVDVDASQKPVSEVLRELLQPKGFEFEMVDNAIVIRQAPAVRKETKAPVTQKVTIQGIVKDSKGAPLPFVAIMVKGTTTGTMSDIEGNYTLTFDKKDNAVLEVSSLGYESLEIAYTGQNSINPVLTESSQGVDEVVVVAYGTRKKGTIAGSVSTIKADKMENVPAAGFDQALQGSTPGLTVVSSSGEPSKAASFQIRGTNSINSGTSPLFILDGVPISSADFNTINPGDIESVSVLKDASSTSIYGARAANGVVVITTKRGQNGTAAKITFRAQAGVSQLSSDNWTLMNTAERIQYEQEIGLDDGQDYDKLSLIDVNWLNMVFNDSAPLQNYELSISGASNDVNYFISANYFDQDGITTGSMFRRYSTRANIELRASEKIKVGTNSMLTYEEFERAEEGSYSLVTPISASRFMLPYWTPYNEDGSLASINDGSWKGTGENPLEWMENNPANNKKYKAISSLFVQYAPTENLTIRSQMGVDYTQATFFTKSNASYLPNNGEGSAGRSSSTLVNLSITNTANYKIDFNKTHFLNFLLGQEGVNYRQESFYLRTAGQTNDKLVNISTGTRTSSWGDNSEEYAYLSFFGRGEYNYLGRYYLDFSVRTDGSSRFGTDSRWATFGSLGLMWDIRREAAFKDRSWLTNLQLAFSTGTSGNSSIPNYDHLALAGGDIDYLGNGGLIPLQRGNENLSWEKLWTSNLALRLGVYNRFNAGIEFYNKLTTDMLMSVPVSYADGGYGFQWDNIGSMVNRGVEMSFDYDVIRNDRFRWNLNANVSYNRNKLVELYNDVDEYTVGTTGVKLVVDHSVSEFYLNRFAGVNPNNGDALWYTKDGEVTTEYNESDKVLTGKSYIAPWQGGFGTTASYAGITLTAQFSWMADRYVLNNDRFFEESNGLYAVYNQSKRLLYDRWKKPGDVTDIPRHGVTPQIDDRFLEDASFLRLKNVMLSYEIPPSTLKKLGFIEKMRVYGQGQNLLTFTSFSGLDPETASNLYAAQYPLTRQFTLGLEIVF